MAVLAVCRNTTVVGYITDPGKIPRPVPVSLQCTHTHIIVRIRTVHAALLIYNKLIIRYLKIRHGLCGYIQEAARVTKG